MKVGSEQRSQIRNAEVGDVVRITCFRREKLRSAFKDVFCRYSTAGGSTRGQGNVENENSQETGIYGQVVSMFSCSGKVGPVAGFLGAERSGVAINTREKSLMAMFSLEEGLKSNGVSKVGDIFTLLRPAQYDGNSQDCKTHVPYRLAI